jgi:hypothetical protein
MTSDSVHSSRGVLSAIVAIGLVAGTLDIADALIFLAVQGVPPSAVFRFIAGALIGTQAAAVGFAPVILGAALHYFIALSWTALFVLASLRFPVLRQRPVIAGLVYAGLVWLAMNKVVVPLSRAPRPTRPQSLLSLVNGVLALIICIGLTISLLTRWRFGNGAAGSVPMSAEPADRPAAFR